MDLFQISDFYLNRIVNADPQKSGQGRNENTVLPGSRIKVLLLDQYTVPIISLNSTQSELLQHEIYLINRIDNTSRDKMRHLKCICFLEPTEESINHLLEELRNPKYSSYELFFNNTLTKTQLERLAESDNLEVVTKVEEVFLEYLTINKDLFSSNLNQKIYGDSMNSWNGTAFNKSVQGLTSVLLSLKARPVIRYEANSKMAAKLSKELIYSIEKTNSQLFDFKLKDSPPLLLILDRKNDPITPLLIPWTYQSMVHELVGIENNTVDLSNSPGISDDLKKVVLSARQDAFYDESMFLNFGDLSDKIKEYVVQYKDKTKTSRSLETIEDMKRFIEEFPEFKKLSGNVSKHMSLVSELDRRINQLRLWEVSELEQNISSHDQHSLDLAEIEKLLLNKPEAPGKAPGAPILEDSKVRLVALYALRYETNSNNQTARLKEILKQQGVPIYKILVIDYLIRLSGVSQRLDDEQTIFDKATSNLISGFKTNHQTNNIYMQHVPRLESILSKAVRGKLSEKNYPILSPYSGVYNNLSTERAQDIIVFIVGGATYEEARVVSELNAMNKGVRIILGGTTIHSTESYIDEIEDAGARWPKTTPGERLHSRVK